MNAPILILQCRILFFVFKNTFPIEKKNTQIIIFERGKLDLVCTLVDQR